MASQATAATLTIEGIEFVDGEAAFADGLVELSFGTPAPNSTNFLDGTSTLGVPDYTGGSNRTGSVSLGNGGFIILKFTDNVLTISGTDSDDLFIFEVGPSVERTAVEIGTAAGTFYSVRDVAGSLSSIDIDAFDLDGNTEFTFVKLTDSFFTGEAGGTVGADIDAVGAISSRLVTDGPDDGQGDNGINPVPLPATGILLIAGLAGLTAMRRRK